MVSYFRIDKTEIITNCITRIVATDNWIIKITPFNIQVAHQSDATLIVNKCDTHFISYSLNQSTVTEDQVQFINIQVHTLLYVLYNCFTVLLHIYNI